MSSQFRTPMFTQVLTSHLDRTLINFSNGSPLALNSVLALDGILSGYADKEYLKEKDNMSNAFKLKQEEYLKAKNDGGMSITEYDERNKSEQIQYASDLFKALNKLMNRRGIHPAQNATDFSEGQDEGEDEE